MSQNYIFMSLCFAFGKMSDIETYKLNVKDQMKKALSLIYWRIKINIKSDGNILKVEIGQER